MQRLQPNFKTDGIRNFMYTKCNGDNAKLRIFFHTATTTYTTQFYEPYIPSNQTNKQNLNNQHNEINLGFTTNTKFMLLQLKNANSGVFIFKFLYKSTNFVHFIHHQFVHLIDPEKPVCGLMNNFVYFAHPYMNPLPQLVKLVKPCTFRQ